MEIRTCTEIVVKKESGEYTLHCPQKVSHHEVYAVATEILQEMAKAMHEIAQMATPKEVPGDETQGK